VKAYLDNNVISAIAKNDTPSESDALRRLVDAYEEGKVDLVTSEVTLQEINAYQGPASVQETFQRLKKIVRWDQLIGMHSHGDERTWINAPMIQNDPVYGSLLKLGVGTVDAQHVFVAAKNACDPFLTCDGGILHRAPAIQDLCGGLIVQRPSRFVEELKEDFGLLKPVLAPHQVRRLERALRRAIRRATRRERRRGIA
jgi:predicted nucleic acid-binding protein